MTLLHVFVIFRIDMIKNISTKKAISVPYTVQYVSEGTTKEEKKCWAKIAQRQQRCLQSVYLSEVVFQ